MNSEQNGSSLKDRDALELMQMPPENYEIPPRHCESLEQSGNLLWIDGLWKTYDGYQAVKGLILRLFEGQIFALLGHNGAGKSTTISMLTGLSKKSKGRASCYGVDMFENMDEVREFMGVCPQHDVLFDLLTPREHLDIFYDLKGGDPSRK